MKVLVPLLLLVTQVAFATPYYTNPNLTLFDKVSEVNKEWLTKDWDNPLLREPIVFQSDETVIQTHLFLVEQYLRGYAPAGLTEAQLEKRNATLDILKGYAQRGLFPKNINHDHRQPYFIDQYGTACAVGYLIIETGHKELAQQVSDEMNYAYIREIPYLELLDWANEYGFTVDELSWIQPAYSTPANWPYDSTGTGIAGTVITMEVDQTNQILYVGGDFITTTPVAENLIQYDGNQWNSIGTPNDTVVNIHVVGGSVMVMGAFDSINGIYTGPIAIWDGQSWEPFGQGLNGTVTQVQAYDGLWYAAGHFTNLGGQPSAYLAQKPFNQPWEATPWTFDKPIEALIEYDQALFIGGYFDLVNGDSLQYLAKWDGDSIWSDLGAANPISAFAKDETYLCIGYDISTGGAWSAEPLIKWEKENDGTWKGFIAGYQFYELEPGMGFKISSLRFSETGLLTAGPFHFAPQYGNWGQGAALYPTSGYHFRALAMEVKGFVNDVILFKDNYYLGGTFDSINGAEIPALAFTHKDVNQGIESGNYTGYYDLITHANGFNFKYSVQGQPPKQPAQVFNINGQLVDAIRPSDGQFTWTTESMPSGLYLVKLPVGENDFAVQKVVVR